MIEKMLPEIWKNKGKILDGIKNRTFKSEYIEQLAEYRNEICKMCDWNSANQKGKEYTDIPTEIKETHTRDWIRYVLAFNSNRCISCNCNIELEKSIKFRSPHSECPRGYWEAMIDKENSEKIKDSIGRD